MKKRILSMIMVIAMCFTMLPMSVLATEAAELFVDEVTEENADTAAEVICTCETDDPAIHATDCPVYAAPENPECYCVEKCTEDNGNVWCDVCGFDITACAGGADEAVPYANDVYDISQGSLNLSAVSCPMRCLGHTITGTTTENSIIVRDGEHNVTLENVEIVLTNAENSPIDMTGENAALRVTLNGDNILTNKGSAAALHVPEGRKLTIDGPGSLQAAVDGDDPNRTGAAIGSNASKTSGNIVINGGTIIATSMDCGAGIGGGVYGLAGSITITGGSVTAHGGMALEQGASSGDAAAIGAGSDSNNSFTVKPAGEESSALIKIVKNGTQADTNM